MARELVWIIQRPLLRGVCCPFSSLSRLLLLCSVWGRWGFYRAHTPRGSCDAIRQLRPSKPRVLIRVINLSGSGERHAFPAVTPEHINPLRPDGEPCLAVGHQQRRHLGPLATVRVVGLHLQDVEALRGVLVVVAAPDGVDEVVEGSHAVPASGQRHGLALRPHVAVSWRVVTQDVSAVRADLIVMTTRDVDDASVNSPSVPICKPRTQNTVRCGFSSLAQCLLQLSIHRLSTLILHSGSGGRWSLSKLS